ncbi:MAG: pitrilysin family protein [Verrucomicrobiota bacterium]
MAKRTIELPAHNPQKGTLSNGLQYLIKEDQRAPIVSLQVWVRVGSIHEETWLGAGMSHLLEHMLFNGTEKRGSREVSEDVQAAGAYINAYTSFDRTVYWIETPPEECNNCLEILGDMTLHSTLPEEEFVKELDVIRREMAMGDDSPGSVVSKLMFATAYLAHPVQFPVIGHREVFDQITYDDLVTFYRRHYVPNNMFMVVSGPVDAKKLSKEIDKVFGGVKRAPLPPVILPPEPRQRGRRINHVEGSTQHTQLRLLWHGPNVTDSETGALDLFSSILGSGRSSLLYRKLRDELGLVHSVTSFVYSMPDTGLFVIAAEVDADKREEAEAEILKLLNESVQTGITKDELTKALNMALSESLDSLTTTRGVASDIGSSWMLTGNPEFTQDYIRDLQAISPEEVSDTARRWIHPLNFTTVSLNPEGSLTKAKKRRTKKSEGQTERFELNNGLTLLVCSDRRLPLATVHTAMRGGLLAEHQAPAGLTRVFSKLLTRDTKSRSAEEVANLIENVGGDFNSFSGFNSLGLSSELMAPDWRIGLEAIATALKEPAFIPDTLQREREFQIASIRSELDRPMTQAAKLMRETLFANHAYRNPLSGTEESMHLISQDDLIRYQGENVLAKNTVMAVYGDVDGDEVKDAVEEALGSLPSGDRRFSGVEAVPTFAETKRLVETESDKQQTIVLVAFPAGGVFSEDLLTLELIDDACSDMSSRLYVKIREELGAAYMVGTSRILGFAGGCFYFYTATSPEQADEVEAGLLSEIEHLGKNGIAPDELARAKRSWQGSHKNRLQSLASCARTHAMDELYDFGWDHSFNTPKLMDAIDGDRVRETAERYFLDKPHVIVRFGPEG